MPWDAPYYGSKAQQIALWDALVAKHPAQLKKEFVGNYRMGGQIPMYRLGNPKGGKWLFDGAIHGCSDLSTIIHLQYFTWLLESGDARAINIVQKKQLLCIPIINWSTVRKNMYPSPNGVDLNRNQNIHWGQGATSSTSNGGGSTTSTSDYYIGASAASEPESQALEAVMRNEKPQFYTNFHNWGGPLLMGEMATSADAAIMQTVMNNYKSLAGSMGNQKLYNYGPSSPGSYSPGYALGYAASLGIKGFLLEIVSMNGTAEPPNYNQLPSLDMISSYYFPRLLPFYLAVSQALTDGPVTPPACNSYTTQAACTAAGCYWYDNACHSTPQTTPPPVQTTNLAPLALLALAALMLMI